MKKPLRCRLGIHSARRSQGLVGYCERGCGDLRLTANTAGGWVRYVDPDMKFDISQFPAGLPAPEPRPCCHRCRCSS